MDFIVKHFEIFVSIALALMTLGIFKYRILELEAKVKTMDAMGTSFNRENGIKIAEKIATLEHRTNVVEGKLDTMTNILYEIRTDVKLVEAWIQQQPKQHNARH